MIDAQTATSTYDCRVGGCDGEARLPGGRCDYHERLETTLALEQASARLKAARESYAAARARLDAALDELLEEPAA